MALLLSLAVRTARGQGSTCRWVREVMGTLLAVACLFSPHAHAHGPGPDNPAGTAYAPPPYVPPPQMAPGQARVAPGHAHEVWLVDQSNSPGRNYGGSLYIYDPAQLRANAASAAAEKIDLGGTTSDLCLTETAARPVRPHMITFSPGAESHAILSFVASGHVVFFDAATRQPLRCFRTEAGAGGARQAHAIWPTPDARHVLVANQNGKKFERIRTDYVAGVFVQEPSATLDLAGCITPNGQPCQAPALRPDNAPICPFVPASGRVAFVSLRGGGMLVLDVTTTPMSIVAEYDAVTIPRDGCGFVESSGWVYGNGGGGNAANLDGWFIYRVPADQALFSATNAPNQPPREIIDRDSREFRDAHGVARTRNDKYVWFFDRNANVVEIFRSSNGHKVGTVNIAAPGISLDPTPDLVGEAPDGRFVYVSLRGPSPLSGDPHASTGSTPGLLVIEVLQDGRALAVRGLARISNVDGSGVERADGHGIRVRRLGAALYN